MLNLIKRIIYRVRFKIDPIGVSRSIGVKIGERCRLCGDVDWGSEPYLVSIGDHVSITTSKFVTHDGAIWVYRDEEPDIDVVKPVRVGSNVFIGADCILLPGTVIEDNVIVGAGSIVRGCLKEGGVYAGVPVKWVKSIDEYYAGLGDAKVMTKCLNPVEKKSFLVDLYGEKKDCNLLM